MDLRPILHLPFLIVLTAAATAFAQPLPGNPLNGLEELKTFEPMRASSSDAHWKNGNADARYIQPGGTLTLADLDGPGCIVHIWCTIAHDDPFYPRKLTLRMYWDGEEHPSVECPIGDFFGMGHGIDKPFTSLPIRVTSDGRGRNCYWPMPFRKHARITVSNDSDKPCNNFYYYIDWQKHRSIPKDAAYFHAMYRQEFPCVMGRNYLIAEIEGRGHYVGTIQNVTLVSPGWYGEGDDFFFVDGEKEPRLRGTGTEDYFCDGWGFREQSGPFYGTPLFEGYETGDRVTAYRFHVPDPIPFKKSLRVEIEHKGTQTFPDGKGSGFIERDDLMSSVAFWYQIEPHKPWPALPPAEERLGFRDRIVVKGHEAISTATHSQHPIEIQPFGGTSDGKQLWFRPGDDTGWVEISFETTRAESGDWFLRMVHSWDYGIYRVKLDGKDAGTLDLYNASAKTATDRLGRFDLTPGKHTLRFECTGKAELSAGYFLGFDALTILTPAYSRAPEVDLRTLQKSDAGENQRHGATTNATRRTVARRLQSISLAPGQVVPDTVRCVVPDRQDEEVPAGHLDGFLGVRVDANVSGRLLSVDEARLLEGFRHRPGRQAWDGEHVGKWLHAATLAWAFSGDPRLREKLDRVVGELRKCQLDDGYLGTYLPEQRWTDWDVWAHKYDMIGLLTYYRFTGNAEALEMSCRCADLLCRTFGDGPGQRDLLDAGWHMGMAPTSVLEPMVLIYRLTGDRQYLDFCRYILDDWETPKGPKIVSTLLNAKRVDKVGNAKAYEMLSCLNGLLEFHRTTGDEKARQAALNAWQDIVDKRLYVTGTTSYKEFFHDDYDLPNGNADVGETCGTVTWIQLNAQLLRITGEPRFAEEIERSVYNHLLGAQKPDGTAWGYYVQLEGKKPYSSDLSGHCCLSSGPRGVALIPTVAATTDAEGVVINFPVGGQSTLNLRDGRKVQMDTRSGYPADGQSLFVVHPSKPGTFSVKIRIPAWAPTATIQVNGRALNRPVRPGQYTVLRRQWRDADQIALSIPLKPRLLVGDHGNRGKVAFAYGPLILAADDALNRDAPIGSFRIDSTNLENLAFETRPMPEDRRTCSADRVYSINATLTTNVLDKKAGDSVQLHMVSFANAGSTLAPYQVWMRGPAAPGEKSAAGAP